MIVFHATPKYNSSSIARAGVLAACSRGRERCSWWVSRERVAWAVEHVSLRHNVCTRDIAVFSANIMSDSLVRSGKPGVFKCFTASVHASEIAPYRR